MLEANHFYPFMFFRDVLVCIDGGIDFIFFLEGGDAVVNRRKFRLVHCL